MYNNKISHNVVWRTKKQAIKNKVRFVRQDDNCQRNWLALDSVLLTQTKFIFILFLSHSWEVTQLEDCSIRMGFQPTIPVLERENTFQAFDRAATMISSFLICVRLMKYANTFPFTRNNFN
jgi:hypothetical protein